MKKLKSTGFALLYLAIPIVLQFAIGIVLGLEILMYSIVVGRGKIDTDIIMDKFSGDQYTLILVALLNLILIAGFGLWYYFIRTRKDISPVSYRTIFSWKSIRYTIGMALCAQFITNLIMIGFRFAFPTVYDNYVELAEGLDIHVLPAWAMIFIVVIWSPFAEELIFRGMIFRTLRKGFSFVPAAVISGVAFGVYHMNWVQGVYAGALGILLAYTYEKTNSLAGCYLFHFMFNLSSYGIEALQNVKGISEDVLALAFLAAHVVAPVGIVLLVLKFSRLYPKPAAVSGPEGELPYGEKMELLSGEGMELPYGEGMELPYGEKMELPYGEGMELPSEEKMEQERMEEDRNDENI